METENGYPTSAVLEKIKDWDTNDFHGLMEYIREYWIQWGSFKKDGEIYTLATGGWSGNEDIISSLSENFVFWSLYWESSNRGGRHVFALCTLENIQKLSGL